MIRADSNFRAGSWAAFEALIVPKLIKAVTAATDAVFVESQNLVAVDTGDLKASGSQSVQWADEKVTGWITYSADHAAYVEYGTGQRGAASPGAGPFTYAPNWKGMPAQPYIRPALDTKRLEIQRAFEDEGFKQT